MTKIIPKIFQVLWKWFWLPYGWMIAHRAGVGHAPLIGTMTRLLYIAVPVVTLLWIFDVSLIGIPPRAWRLAGGMVIGLLLSDLAHAVMDVRWRKLPGQLRRGKRRKTRKTKKRTRKASRQNLKRPKLVRPIS